jgi:hypothetical protein
MGKAVAVHAKPRPWARIRVRAMKRPRFRRGSGDGMFERGNTTQHGKPGTVRVRDPQLDAREGQARPHRVAERPVVPKKPGNAGRGKGPWFKAASKVTRARRVA